MILSFQDDSQGRRRRRPDPEKEHITESRGSRGRRPPAGEVGQALRAAYQRMIDEDIPPEMLDLLGKLG